MKKTITLVLFALGGTMLYSQVNTQSFTASGNFVVPAGVTSLTIEVVGAGGTGAGNGGGGGGGGGYAIGVYNVSAGATIPITIGTGGSGQVGGTSSAGAFISATGGANGTTVSNPNIGGGGAGGVGSNGTIANYTGGTGGGGYWTYFGGGGGGAAGALSNGSNGGNTIAWTGICQTPGGSAGASGGAPGGAGGKGAGFTDSGCNITNPSAAGASYGGGGGGGNGNGGGVGTGANGYCHISWGGCVAPPAPVNTTAAGNLTICGSGTTTLSVSSTGSVTWFYSPSGPTSIGTGSTFVTPVLSTTLTFFAEAANSCTNSATRTAITVTVNPLPTISVASSHTLVCAGGQATLNASGGNSYAWSLYDPATMTFSTGPQTVIQPTAATGYTVTGTDANGCSADASFTVAYGPVPNVFVSPASSDICVGETAVLTAVGAVSYSWNGVAGSPQFTANPTTTTTYTLTGAGPDLCTKTVTITQTVSICTGIAGQPETAPVFAMYPNPARSEFSITGRQNLQLELLNELGQVVKVLELTDANHYQVQVKGLAPGLYFVTDKAHRQVSQKIIISE